MDSATLTKLGLNESQATMYLHLVRNGSLSPPEAAKKLDIKRTNAYAVLDQLVELGLAKSKDVNKKLKFYAENPVALERLAVKQRDEAMAQERKVQASLPTLLKYFHTFSDKPGIRFYQGIDEIKEIYNDTLRTCKDIYVFRSPHDQDLLTTKFYTDYKTQRAKLGIKTYIMNGSDDSEAWNDHNDAIFNLVRTQINSKQFTAQVEIASYGDKVSIISFGDEAMGMIIHSPQIAEAIRQIYKLAELGSVKTG